MTWARRNEFSKSKCPQMTPNWPKTWPQAELDSLSCKSCPMIMQNLALGMQDQDLRPEYLTTSILYFFVITLFLTKL